MATPLPACAPNVGGAPTAYAGWPGGGKAIAPNANTIPVLASRDLAVGPNRFLLTIIDSQNANLASASMGVSLAFFNLAADPTTPAATSAGVYFDNGAGKGLYRGTVTFPCWGDWGVEVKASRPSGVDAARVVFDVQATSSTPSIGAPAPRAETPTASSAAGIAAISTDKQPDPDFYRLTITQAETSGKPSLIIFATPAFCQSATCGPALDVVKQVARSYKGKVNFVHVEPYQLQKTDTGLQPILGGPQKKDLQTVPAANDFGLLTEPFAFVLDAGGLVAAKFDGIMGQDELKSALDAVTR